MKQVDRKEQDQDNAHSSDDLLELIDQELDTVAGGEHTIITGCLGIRA